MNKPLPLKTNYEGLTCESGLENIWLLSSGDHGRRCMLREERNHNNQSIWMMHDVLKTSSHSIWIVNLHLKFADWTVKPYKSGLRECQMGREREGKHGECSTFWPFVSFEWNGWNAIPFAHPLFNGTIPMAPHCVGYSCTYSLGMCLESREQLLPTLLSRTNKLSAVRRRTTTCSDTWSTTAWLQDAFFHFSLPCQRLSRSGRWLCALEGSRACGFSF